MIDKVVGWAKWYVHNLQKEKNMAEIDQDRIQRIVAQVVKSLRTGGEIPQLTEDASQPAVPTGLGNGVFEDVDAAIDAAEEAQKRCVELGLAKRKEIIEAIRKVSLENARMLAEMAYEETQMGVFEHKIMKNEGAANFSPGVEDITAEAVTGDNGLLLVEHTPFGVINSIAPVTNPTSTVINNSIIMLAAGNSIIFSPHPAAKNCSQKTMTLIHEAIVEAGGPENLLVCVAEPSLRAAKQIMDHPKVAMIVATGGGSVVKAALSSGKKAIAAGPGNPPVIVDETADIPKAGYDIIAGASFDNNILCIGEKSVFVLEEVADELLKEFEKNGGYLANESELKAVEELVVENHGMKREYIGKDATTILAGIGVKASSDVTIIVVQPTADHIFVTEEFLMPILPVMRVKTFDEAVQLAVATERGYTHTAIIHSKDNDRITQFARAAGTTIFVVNAPSFASEGLGGESFLAMTVAGPTGEGFTRPKTFTRERRLTFAGGISVHTSIG